MCIMKAPIVDNKIPLLFSSNYDYGNFGDLLSRYIVEKISKKEIIKYEYDAISSHFCAIGSILSRNEICSQSWIWGSGFISPQKSYKIKLTAIRQFFRRKYGKATFFAVRGKKTREILLDAGLSCPEIYGDPALLMPSLYTPKKAMARYRVGIICHTVHEELPSFFKNDMDGVLKIAINRKYDKITDFVDEVCSCDVILSSSLHGLIIANAYDIPAVRFVVNGHSLHPNKYGEERQNFKYEDYLSGLNALSCDENSLEYTFPCIELYPNQHITKELIEEVYSIASKPSFKWSAQKLLEAFPYN